jgi:hypothetical protein
VKHTETRDQTQQSRKIVIDETNKGLVGALQHLSVGKKPSDKMFPDMKQDAIQSYRCETADKLLSIFGPEKFDPAYAHAMKKNDFFPRYAVGVLPKNEMILRRDEWNAAVDDYISSENDDDRDELEISQQAKIAMEGSRLYKECANCGEIEEEVGQFMGCSRCKMRQYCHKDCQVEHWKAGGHKRKCGKEKESENETLYCSSQKCLASFMEVMSSSLPGLMPGMPMGGATVD